MLIQFKFGRESDTLKYKKQTNKVNNMKKKAKENFESNFVGILCLAMSKNYFVNSSTMSSTSFKKPIISFQLISFNFRNVRVKPTRLNNLLDPIIISDTMTPLYSDVFKMPSEISHHDAAVAFLKCPKSTSCFPSQN
jgi:hypothetical protein